jgi:hypothetical protein
MTMRLTEREAQQAKLTDRVRTALVRAGVPRGELEPILERAVGCARFTTARGSDAILLQGHPGHVDLDDEPGLVEWIDDARARIDAAAARDKLVAKLERDPDRTARLVNMRFGFGDGRR